MSSPKKTVVPCVGCGNHEVAGITAHDFRFDADRTEIDWAFCPNCMLAFALRRLAPRVVRRMRQVAGCGTFYTHDDFYDEEGVSIQPVK